MSATLDAPVDQELLGQAMQIVIRRFPSFRFTVRNGLFWWFLQRLENDPSVGASGPLRPVDPKRNGGYMFRLSCSGARIDLDVYHALTDGTGALTFLMSIVAEYLKRSEGVNVEYGHWVYDPDGDPVPEEIEDGFDSFSGTKGALDDESPAWHVKGKVEAPDILNSFGVSFSEEQIKAKARELDCTVTELVSTLIMLSLQDVHEEQKGRRKHIRMELPVNLRPIFGSRTLRNFASYIYMGLDLSNGSYSFTDALREVKYQKRLFTQPARLKRRIAANVAIEDNFFIRIVPLVLKRPVINLINHLKGDNYATYTFSNIGKVELPAPLAAHVRDIHFVLGRTMGRSGSCAGVSFNGTMNVNFTRKIAEDSLERHFVRRLRELGIMATITVPATPLRPSRGEETYAAPVFRNSSLLPKFLFSI